MRALDPVAPIAPPPAPAAGKAAGVFIASAPEYKAPPIGPTVIGTTPVITAKLPPNRPPPKDAPVPDVPGGGNQMIGRGVLDFMERVRVIQLAWEFGRRDSICDLLT